MAKQPKAPKKPAPVHVATVAYIADGDSRKPITLALDLPATTAETRADLEKALGGAVAAELAADENASAAGWKTARAVADVYRACLGSGMNDGAAWAHIGGWNADPAKRGVLARAYGSAAEKNRVNYTAKAGRGLALGIAPEDGEALKAYAARVGGLHASRVGAGGGDPESEKARKAAATRCLKEIGEARASASKARGFIGASALALLEKAEKAARADIEKSSASAAAQADA